MIIRLEMEEIRIIAECLEYFSRHWEKNNVSTFDLEIIEDEMRLEGKDFYNEVQDFLERFLTHPLTTSHEEDW